MAETRRRRLQGLRNVVAFNWPFYLVAAVVTLGLGLGASWVPGPLAWILRVGAALSLVLAVSSLGVSFWVYDLSDLYRLPWLSGVTTPETRMIAALNAGFDEVSFILRERLPQATCHVLDFYDPKTQTEASIERARRAQGAADAVPVSTADLPLEDAGLDLGVAFMSAHEIRDRESRVDLFRELRRALKPEGRVVVVEHLRDGANFLAYNVGFLHFLSRRVWLDTFQEAGLRVEEEIAQTPFVSVFVLRPGDEP